SSLDLSELAKAAKKKLQSLSNHLFEELAMDVYDEVDRRETDAAVWLATQNHSTLVTETTVVPFLPVNPEYSSTRNQGRQKLARFNAHEFATLVIDILSDAKRRQQGNPLTGSKGEIDIAMCQCRTHLGSKLLGTSAQCGNSLLGYLWQDTSVYFYYFSNSHAIDVIQESLPFLSFFFFLSKALEGRKLKKSIHFMYHLISQLCICPTAKHFFQLQTLQSENTNLRRQATTNIYQGQTGSEYTDPANNSSLKRRPSARGSRPMSMYETGSGQKPYLPMGEVTYPEESITRLQPFPPHIGRSAFVTSSSSLPSFPSTLSWSRDESTRRTSKLEKQSSVSESDYDNPTAPLELEEMGSGRKGRQRSVIWQGEGSIPEDTDTAPSSSLPSTEDVIRKTEQITKNIQELLRAAQENKHDSYIPCSERIHVAVTEMAALFPKKPKSELVRTSLRLLTSSAYRLQSECKKTLPVETCPTTDIQLVTQQVIQCAYDIAKAAKQLVTITTKENNN
ncbi:GIT2 protein, partial [Corythaeola cristata]|nr:GIT2 protein [Corythaeola cristata]